MKEPLSNPLIRILFLADTHLGFDDPQKPRIERRRRGDDFYRNYLRALEPAFHKEVDLVVHGGDVFFRSKVPEAVIDKALRPLVQIASSGLPVFIVPGNHERSRIPLHLWSASPNLFVFDQPGTYCLKIGEARLALSGFPFHRHARTEIANLLAHSQYQQAKADVRLLCMHQTVEGATVGPSGYMFRDGKDVIRGKDIPKDFDAVLAGHIHRHQVLHRSPNGDFLAAPVYYPGSIERTSFAERYEDKGFLILEIQKSQDGYKLGAVFHKLPARMMVNLIFDAQDGSVINVEQEIRQKIDSLAEDAVVRVKFEGRYADVMKKVFTASRLRSMAPSTMNIEPAREFIRKRGMV